MSRILLLLSALLVWPVAAQDPDPAGAGDDPVAADPAGAASGRDSPPPQAPPPETDPDNRSPFDYQSSEQISEDLSVSFPVDI